MSGGPARAELAATIADRDARIEELAKDRDAWKACGPQDAEALAIAQCIVALNKVKPPSNQPSYTVTYGNLPKAVDYERILRYLAARYGVPWPAVEVREVQVECGHFLGGDR